MEKLLFIRTLTLVLQINIAIGMCSIQNSKEDQHPTLLENKRSGSITSPQYPNFFPDDITCTWMIIAPKGNVVSVNFISVDVGHVGSCYNTNEEENSYLHVREGKDEESRDIGKFCGKDILRDIVSSGRYLWIRFKASKYRSTRFKADFKIVRESKTVLLVVVATLVSATLLCILLTAICLNKRRRRLNENFTTTPSVSDRDEPRRINSHTEHVVLATPLVTALALSRYFGPAAVYLSEESVKKGVSVNNQKDADTAHVQSVSEEDDLC